jgi:hypothetical protein
VTSDHPRAPTESAVYVEFALKVIPTSLNLGDLEHWWVSSKLDRNKYGIVEGTPEYAALVDACRQRKAKLTKN